MMQLNNRQSARHFFTWQLLFLGSFLTIFFLFSSSGYAQKKPKTSQVDSLPIIPQPGIPADSIIARLEKGHTALNDINNRTRRGFNTWQIDDNLPEVQS